MKLVLLSNIFAIASADLYCPSSGDLIVAYGDSVQIQDGGWAIQGDGGAATKAAFNLLGGYVEFDFDVSQANTGVIPNIYTVSPGGIGGGFTQDSYCDDGKNDHPDCLEVDWIEANGGCGGATTLHTVSGTGDGACNYWGCRSTYSFDGGPTFHMKVEYGSDGKFTITRDGQQISGDGLQPAASGSDWGIVQSNYNNNGAVLYSSQWTGDWVPADFCGGGPGDLGGSHFSISNLRISGSVVQGPEPQKCSGPQPSPSPSPTPGPSWYKTITPSSNTNLCLDLPGDDASNGNQLWLWECNGQESQRWVFDNWQIRFGADESKCIDAGDMSDGNQLFLWDCNGYPQQTWGYDSDAARVYLAGTSTCLDYYGDWQSNGQPLHVWDCTGDWNQEWSIWNIDPSPTPSPPPPPSPTPGPSPQCDCGWAASGCGSDDGSVCWHVCCGSHSAGFLV